MKKQKTKQKGITLIALVISIIVMLILAGVSLNLTIGDNGIIKQAQNATYAQSCAMLEEYLQQYYVKNFDRMGNVEGSKVVILQSLNPNWFYSTRLGYIPDSNGNALYLINKSGLPEEIRKELKGGDAGDGTYSSYAKLIDVYGVTSDLRVYYSSAGIESLVGISSEQLDQDDAGRTVATTSSGSIGLSLLAYDLDGDGKISVQEARSIQNADIDANGMNSIEEIGNLTSLKTLIIRNANLDNLSGIERCSSLYYIYFQNCTIKNYTALNELRNQLTHLIFYNLNDSELDVICSYANGIGDEGKGDSTRDYSKLEYFAVVGESATTRMFSVDNPIQNSGGKYLDTNYKSPKTITKITALDNLSTITKEKIKYLCIKNNNISSLSTLSSFKNLYCLRAEYNKINSISGIEKLTQLNYVCLYDNSLASLIDLDTTSGITKIILGDNQLTSLKGLEKGGKIDSIWAFDNQLGKNIDTEIENSSTDALAGLKSITNLKILDLKNNENIKWVDYIKDLENLERLELLGCTGMDGTSFSSLKKVINSCNYVNYPNSYALSLIDPSIEKLTLSDLTIRKSVFESLIPVYETKNGITQLVSGCPLINQLELSNLNITNESDQKLSATEANTVLNNVLGNLTTLQYLRISSTVTDGNANYSTGDLSTIDFISSGKVTGLLELDLVGVNVSSLSNMNSNATGIKTLVLENLRNTNFTFSDSQTMLNNIYDNNSVTYQKSVFGNYGQKLVFRSSGIYKKLEGLTQLKGLNMYPSGEFGGAIDLDLSGCTSLKYLYGARCFSGCRKVILPASLINYEMAWNVVTNTVDFSRCNKLETIYFNDSSIPNQDMINNTFKTIKQLFTNEAALGKTPALKNIIVKGRALGSFNNFDFFKEIQDCSIEKISIEPYDTKERYTRDITGIKYLKNVQTLGLTKINSSDLSALVPVYDNNGNWVSGCPNLSDLTITYFDYLTDIGCLGQVPNLTSITVTNCAVNNVYGLQNLNSLEYLNLQNNCLYNISSYKDSTGKSVNYNVLQLFNQMNKNKALRRLYIAGNLFDELSDLTANGVTWGGHNGF